MDSPNRQTLTVSEDAHGVRLQEYLQGRWPRADRAQLRELVRDGAVRVNYDDARGDQKLGTGDLVTVDLPKNGLREHVRRTRGRQLSVLLENEHCLVVAKPAGMPSVPDRAGKDSGVHGELESLRPGDDLRIAHRLDRDTSGCLLIARGLEAARWFDECFRGGRVKKEYVALVEGRLARPRVEIRRALGPDPRRPGYVTVVADGTKKSRSAHTDVEVLERFRDHTLLVLRPTTGRGHQLRAHLRSIGHPIVGDVKYGAQGPLLLSRIKRGYKARAGAIETPLLDRFFLHARRLTVPMPEGDGAEIDVTAPLPDDLELALSKVRRFASTDRGVSCS